MWKFTKDCFRFTNNSTDSSNTVMELENLKKFIFGILAISIDLGFISYTTDYCTTNKFMGTLNLKIL